MAHLPFSVAIILFSATFLCYPPAEAKKLGSRSMPVSGLLRQEYFDWLSKNYPTPAEQVFSEKDREAGATDRFTEIDQTPYMSQILSVGYEPMNVLLKPNKGHEVYKVKRDDYKVYRIQSHDGAGTSQYGKNVNKLWRIEADNCMLLLGCSYFDVWGRVFYGQAYEDYLAVNADHYTVYAGRDLSHAPRQALGKGNVVIKFYTNDIREGYGFKCNLKCVKLM